MFGERELDFVRGIVAQHFSVYESQYSPEAMAFHCNLLEEELDVKFEELRLALKREGYIPLLKKETGEHVIFVMQKPPARYRSVRVNLVMLALTCITTTLAGMALWASYKGHESFWTLDNVGNGVLYFALPLMAIIGLHESGHYLMARKNGVNASLPFFIPMPPQLLLTGTMGAVISMREPIPNKKALLEIGISGPLFGFAVAIPVTLVGIYLSNITPHTPITNSGGSVAIYLPLVMMLVHSLYPLTGALHPTLFAGWVGFFVTSLNLLPMGQLDGGHVARALLGERSRYANYTAAGFLMVFGLMYPGWLLIMFFVLFIGFQHPPPLNDITKLTRSRKVLGSLIVVLLVLCFVPKPLEVIQPVSGFRLIGDGGGVDYPLNTTTSIMVKSTGNVETVVLLSFEPSPELIQGGWNASMSWNGDAAYLDGNQLSILLNESESANITISLNSVRPAAGNATLYIIGQMDGSSKKRAIAVDVLVV